MKEAVIYHWWNEISDKPPHLNHRVPLIHSIATLRGVNKEIPIYVLDLSDHTVNYNNWDNKLDFSVIPYKPHLQEYKDKAGWKHLSRTFDVKNFAETIKEEIIIYCDTDVFWINNPLPLMQELDKFCFNKYNSGFWYYNKTSPLFKRFYDLFNSYTITALNDENFRVITRMFSNYNEWYYVLDETILKYMVVKMPELFNILTIEEHLTPSSGRHQSNIQFDKVKMLHLHGTLVDNPVEIDKWRKNHNRGLSVLIIKELYENAIKSIGEDRINIIFEKEIGLFKQVSMFNEKFIKSFVDTHLNGFYNLNEALEKLETITFT